MGVGTEEKLGCLGKFRFLFNSHCYGSIFVYASFWTIIKHFLVLFASLFGIGENREELLTRTKATVKKKFRMGDETEVVIAETARSLFYAFLLAIDLQEDEYVISTPMQHYSFLRIFKALKIKTITMDMKKDGTGWDFEGLMEMLTPETTRKCRALLVTHQFGNNQPYDEMARFCNENDISIFEDNVQGFSMYQTYGHPLAHMSVFSGGMDKIPCTTKGGFGLVKNNPVLAQAVENVIENFPDKTWNKRLKDLCSQFAYWFLTGTKFGCFCVIWMGLFWQNFTCLSDIIHWVRKRFLKAYVGVFTVDRVSFRPSMYHLLAIITGVERSERSEIEMLHRSRSKFRSILGEYAKVCMPWAEKNKQEDANLYFHAVFRERDILMRKLSDNGWGMCYQQAWACCGQHPAFPPPTYAQHLTDNATYFPLTHQMLESEMKDMAKIAIEHIEQYQPDHEPYFPVEA